MKDLFTLPRTFRSGLSASVVFGTTGKAVGYGRQLLIAYYFGISRGLDIYYMAFSIAAMMVFSANTLFDHVALPHLVRHREAQGDDGFREMSGSVFTISIALGALLTLAFILLSPLVSYLIAHGFSRNDLGLLNHMVFYFIPWLLLSMPHGALSSILQSLGLYNAVFFADFLIVTTATVTFYFWHSSVHILPLTFGLGYGLSLAWLMVIAHKRVRLWGTVWSAKVRPIYRNFMELTVSNQIGSLSTAVDRFFQSFQISGSIAGIGYITSILNPLVDLCSFNEVYMVPLSSSKDFLKKLQRLLSGFVLLSVPMAVFICLHSEGIMRILYERGRFDQQAAHFTARLLSIYSLTLISSLVGTPIFRVFQILDRIRYSSYGNFFYVGCLAVLNALFFFRWHLGIFGVAWAYAISNGLSLLFNLCLLDRAGVKLNMWVLLRDLTATLALSLVAFWVVNRLPVLHPNPVNLITRTGCYVAIMACLYWPLRSYLSFIVNGV